ncbi:MATE family efflux transporter [Huintestinicola sp.]|uniref:MATE family efflux transporter n=1 Tax=Huintestinicola sp. TaxID=2981661 RepID=UPI003D7E0289
MKMKYLQKLMIISVPIMLSNIISQVQMIIDRIFLGQMNTLYMSALGNVTAPMWTTMSFCFTIVMGASILISQSVGAGDDEKVESYAASMIKWNNILPILLFFFWLFGGEYVLRAMGVSEDIMPMCLGYMKFFAPTFLIVGIESSFSVIMQTSNYTKPLVFYGIIRAGLNILLDWLLIFGRFGLPRLGIEGAAIATTVAEYGGCLFAFIVITNKPLKTKPSPKSILTAPAKPFISSVGLGINAGLEDFAWNLGNLIIIRILNSIDVKAAGIYSIVFSVEVLAVVVIGAIGNGTMTLSGEAKGSGDIRQFSGVCKIAYLLCAGVAILILIICLIFPENILSLFTKDEEIITGCGIYLLLVCLNLFGKSGNIIIGSGIRGSGNTRWMFFTQIFGTFFVVGCACLFVYGLGFGMTGVFLAVMADEAVRSVINLFKLRKILLDWDKTGAVIS